ncbi:MAG: tetratricopeptide repeat protein [Muribaculaceae bacterium]|nr:tetratricopeptide repeat protein [Muribaculaceae bacterium]
MALMLALGAASCSKKQSAFLSDYFSTNPTPLQTVGQNVPAEITGRIPAKVMVKNAKVTTTPVLVWTDGQAQGQPIVFQGVDVKDNGQTVPETGGSVMIPFLVAYQPAMQNSDLYLDFTVDQRGKTYTLPRVKVGYGVIATSTLAGPQTVHPAIAPDQFQRVISEKYSTDIHFLINQANIRANQTDQASYIDLNRQLVEANQAPNKEIAGISVNSYASPEGTLAFNTALAEKREQNTTSLVEAQLKRDKITEFGELTSSFTPEDWEGFQQLVEKSNIQDKDLILSVLSMYKDPEQREKEIRNLSSVFSELADQILPQLRYSRIQATINVIGKSDEELINLFNTDPQKLTVDEILYIATLTDDNTRKMDIYKKAAEIYPNDYRTANNLGVTQYRAGDYDNASKNFDKAARLNPSSKEAAMNKGLIYMLHANWTQANESLGAAAGLPANQDALGVYYLSQGEVQKAKTAFGDAKTNNAALAQILAGDYTAARNTLAAIPTPDAITYYLTAVLGARTDNTTMVLTNLREAVKLDSSLLTRARKDLEFRNFNLSSL